jgi:hypothetical protein
LLVKLKIINETAITLQQDFACRCILFVMGMGMVVIERVQGLHHHPAQEKKGSKKKYQPWWSDH